MRPDGALLKHRFRDPARMGQERTQTLEASRDVRNSLPMIGEIIRDLLIFVHSRTLRQKAARTAA